MAEVELLMDFDRPRCHAPVHERLYGPCDSCRNELAASFSAERFEIEHETDVPMAGVANLVATNK